MHSFNCKAARPTALMALTLAASLTGAGLAPTEALAKSSVAYVPGVSLVPEVLMPDGVTDRTYNTTQGLSLWTDSLPVLQGDKVKLNVFAATGGAELKEIKIRLDNTKIADVSVAPWRTLLDTATMQPGYHMVEVWAQASGDRPQATTKTLMFFVTKQLDPKYLVQGSQQVLTNGTVSNVPLESGAAADVAPATPTFLQGQTVDPTATVTLTARSAASNANAGGADVTGGTATINEPTLFLIQPAPSSTATQFAYALVRDGQTFNASTEGLPVNYQRVLIQKRTDTAAGLRSGTVTMWVWGINAQGQPGDPVKTQLSIP